MRIDRIKLITELAKRRMSQSKLADECGVSRATINAIYNGRSCSDNTGYRIALTLNVDVKELLED